MASTSAPKEMEILTELQASEEKDKNENKNNDKPATVVDVADDTQENNNNDITIIQNVDFEDDIKEILVKEPTIKSAINQIQNKYGTKLCQKIIVDAMNHYKEIVFEDIDENKLEYPTPRPFTPAITTLVDNITDWHELAKDESNGNFKIRCFRAILLLFVPIALITYGTYYCFILAEVIGITLAILFFVYFGFIMTIVLSAGHNNCMSSKGDSLYRIYSISQRPESWPKLNMSYINLLYKNSSIQSISELSAIYGGAPQVMLNVLGAYVWCSVLIHFAAQLYYNEDGFVWDISDYFALIGTAGLLLVSVFELDPFSLRMGLAHYIGALMGAGTVVAYNLQQNSYDTKSWFPIIIVIVDVLFFVSWQLAGVATDIAQREKKDLPTDCCCQSIRRIITLFKSEKQLKEVSVNTYSRWNIGCEALFLWLGATSLCLWLIEYVHDGCSEYNLIGCADRVRHC